MSKSPGRIIESPKNDKNRILGFGAAPPRSVTGREHPGFGGLLDLVRQSTKCPVWTMPVIHQVRWTLSGPQLDKNVTENFGAKIDLFGNSESVPGVNFVETTFAQPGESQTSFLACALGFHLEPEPLCWTALGNAWTIPKVSKTPPISPDVFTEHDIANGALGLAGTDTMLPAVLEWGWWANLVAWNMVRGYNLRWTMGRHCNITDDVLRHTAYMPTNAQDGTGSNSEVDVVDFVRRANVYYRANASDFTFLKVNRRRIGSIGAGAANFGIFRPTRDFDLVPATYGGIDLRKELRGNSEFKMLTVPYVVPQGVPFGLSCQEVDTVQANLMRRELSITQSFEAGIPPQITDDGEIPDGFDGTGVAPVGLELTLDAVPVPVAQRINTQRVPFKMGELKISQLVKGFEVDEDWYTYFKNNPDVRDALASETGLSFV
jgi:hypothetical protein